MLRDGVRTREDGGVFLVNVCQELRKINTKFLWFGRILTGGVVCSTDGGCTEYLG